MGSFNGSDSITISLDKFGQAKFLSDCIFHSVREGITSLTVNISESFTGSNVCAPIAGIIDYYRNKGVRIHVEVPQSSYAFHVRIPNPIPAEDIISDYSPFDKVFSFSSEECLIW